MAFGLVAAATLLIASTVVFVATKLEAKTRKKLQELFVRETGDRRTYDDLRKAGYIGYTHRYLKDEFDLETLETAATVEIALEMLKLDLAEGTKPEEIVFRCCFWCPKLEMIEAIIESTNAKIEDIFNHQDEDGNNCLMIMFQVLVKHKYNTGKDPVETEMATEVEQSVEYLIGLADKNKLDMKEILKKTSKTGNTLLSLATFFSEKIAWKLLQRGVNAKSINHVLQTPSFKFQSLHRAMISAGVNPFALDHSNTTQYDLHNVSVPILPEMTTDLFFSTHDLPCYCPVTCHQDPGKAWYYQNGIIWDFKASDLIGKGGEGAVFEGCFHGQEAAFKLVEIRNLKFIRNTSEAVDDLKRRLNEMINLTKSEGPNILPFYGHVRQQLSADKVSELGLGDDVKRFEIYITKKCDSNLAEMKKFGQIDNIDKAKNIIDQLFVGLEGLQAAGISHNDIKPANILIDDDGSNGEKVYIGDFGLVGKLGGTPGWTKPDFSESRVPGVSDLYSFGLLILYILCEDVELFFAIRDNFVLDQDKNQQWYKDFQLLPEITFIRFLTGHKRHIRSFEMAKQKWNKLKASFKMLTSSRVQMPTEYVTVQGLDTLSIRENIHGRNLTETDQPTRTTFTRTHLQGETNFCWLYSVTSSIHHSMNLKLARVRDKGLRNAGFQFLTVKNFHQALRNEILFGLIPKSTTDNTNQSHSLVHLMYTLNCNSFLKKDAGLLQLLSVRKFFDLIWEKPKFTIEKAQIKDFVNIPEYPLVTVHGIDSSENPPLEFGHAVLMTKCTIVSGSMIEIELKNSLEGEHLNGVFDFNAPVLDIELSKTKSINQNIKWFLKESDAWYICFN